jgi:hypothetical protein
MALLLALLPLAVHAQPGHDADCAMLGGIGKARCERHQRMSGKCSPIKGEAHLDCDRDFLIANPLDCVSLKGADRSACVAEREALVVCRGQCGRGFFECTMERLRTDPRH